MTTALDESLSGEKVQSFVDVLGTRSAWPDAGHSGGDSYFASRRRLPLPDGSVSIESVSLAAGQSGQAVLTGDEFVLVLNGTIRVRQAAHELLLGTGEAGVVVRDRPLDWATDGTTELLIMRCEAGGGAGADKPVLIDVGAQLSPSNPPLADLLIGPTPSCRNHSDYRSASGEFVCGTWDSTPYHRRLMIFRHFELMKLLEGQVTFVDEEGRSGYFGPGDVVLFVQGGGCSWESRTYVKKIYSTYRPAG
ncbi:MAG: cupin domain-containing protein [Sphingomicrobium sp.]